jgi:hypothetical protein
MRVVTFVTKFTRKKCDHSQFSNTSRQIRTDCISAVDTEDLERAHTITYKILVVRKNMGARDAPDFVITFWHLTAFVMIPHLTPAESDQMENESS